MLITVQAVTLLAHLNSSIKGFVMRLVPLELMKHHHLHAKVLSFGLFILIDIKIVRALVKLALQLRRHASPAFQIFHIFLMTIAITPALMDFIVIP